MQSAPPVHDTESEPLLVAIKARLDALTTLRETVSSHWHAEDKFYRFYHQSWKLYGLQRDTSEIVEALRDLWPEKQLHPWFAQIITEGTGHEFSSEDNSDWLRKGRPILEAFFHARTMLELAVKYGRELDHAPRMMPSGWAALLELYSARYCYAGNTAHSFPVPQQGESLPKASGADEPFRLD